MAALALLPPPISTNSKASILPSGGGNSLTRNTSSSTPMPAHRMRPGSRRNVPLHPCTDDVVGDREWRRRGQAAGMAARQHRGRLVARKPARVLELGVVDLDIVRQRLGM